MANAFFNMHQFSDYYELLGYFGILLFFVTLDQITPIPEEISLLTIGYLSAHKILNPFYAGVVSLFAFLVVDTVYFFLAKGGDHYLRKKYKKIKHSWFTKLKNRLQHNFPKTLLVLCFIPRMRLFAPLASGAMGVGYKRFLLFDTIGLSLFTTLYITLGFVFHNGLHAIAQEMETVQHILFFAAIVLLGVVFLFFFGRRYLKN